MVEDIIIEPIVGCNQSASQRGGAAWCAKTLMAIEHRMRVLGQNRIPTLEGKTFSAFDA
jgi:hypothetical protein